MHSGLSYMFSLCSKLGMTSASDSLLALSTVAVRRPALLSAAP